MKDDIKVRAHGLVNKPEEAMRWLERLTPQGSEFYDDPENCFHFIMRQRISRWDIIKKQQKEIKELRDKLKIK